MKDLKVKFPMISVKMKNRSKLSHMNRASLTKILPIRNMKIRQSNFSVAKRPQRMCGPPFLTWKKYLKVESITTIVNQWRSAPPKSKLRVLISKVTGKVSRSPKKSWESNLNTILEVSMKSLPSKAVLKKIKMHQATLIQDSYLVIM